MKEVTRTNVGNFFIATSCLVEKVRVNVKLPPSNFNTDLTFAGREAFFKFRTEVSNRELSEI